MFHGLITSVRRHAVEAALDFAPLDHIAIRLLAFFYSFSEVM